MTAPEELGRIVFGPQDESPSLDMPHQPQVVVRPRDYTPEEVAAHKAAEDKQAALEKAAMRLVRREQLLGIARSVISDIFVLAGISGLAWAGFMFAVWLGVAIGSIGLIIVGVSIDPPQWSSDDEGDAATGAGREGGP